MTWNHIRLAGRRVLILASLALLLGAASAAASDLGVLCADVNPLDANPNTGDCGARIGVASSCVGDNHELLTGTIGAGAYVGCSTLSAEADLTSGVATFTAGDLVILRNGFSVATGASLTVEIDRDLYPDAWVQDDTPDGETVYSARFYVDPTGVDLELTQSFYHFLAFDGGGAPELRVGMKQDDSEERRLFLEVFLDGGGVATTEGANELELPDGWRWVEVGWTASTGTNNGSAYLCVDQGAMDPACEPLSSLDNDTGAIDFVRWGAIDVPSDSSLGNLDLDDFESRRSLNIGPLS
jgi:hypothetical protein